MTRIWSGLMSFLDIKCMVRRMCANAESEGFVCYIARITGQDLLHPPASGPDASNSKLWPVVAPSRAPEAISLVAPKTSPLTCAGKLIALGAHDRNVRTQSDEVLLYLAKKG